MTSAGDGTFEPGATPLALGQDCVWLVVEGSVDVFAIPDGGGARHHLWSAEPGDLIPPAPPASGAGFALMAVGMGSTRLERLPSSALGDPSLAPAIERLVAAVSPLLLSSGHAALHDIFLPGRQLELGRGKRAGIREPALWLRVLEGSARIGARDGFELTPSTGWVPLQDVWLEAGPEGGRIEALDTRTHLERGGDGRGVHVLLGLLQSAAGPRMAAAEANASARLHARALSDRSIWRNALGRLAGIVRADEVGWSRAEAGADLLLAACRAVGSAAGIEFREPAQWEKERVPELLSSICRVSRVRSRRVALRGDWWARDVGPLLGYLREDGAPVALLLEGRRRVLLDPRDGTRREVTPDVAAALQPFAVTFTRPLPAAVRGGGGLLAFSLPRARVDLGGITAASLAAGLLSLAVPLATAHVFNQVIPNARPGDLVTVLVALAAAAVGSALFDLMRAFALTRAEGRVSAAMQAAIVDRLLALPAAFFRRFPVGDLSQRAAAIQAMQDVVGTSTVTVVLGSVFSALNLVVLVYYDWRLSLMAMTLLGGALVVNALLMRQTMRHERSAQEAQGRVSGLVFQILAGMAKIRVSGSEARAFGVWSGAFAVQRDATHRAGAFRAAMAVFNDALPILAAAALYATGGWMMFERGLALRTGDFVAFAAAFGALFGACVALSNTAAGLVAAAAILEKARPILETAPEVTEAKDDPGQLEGLVEGVHLTFRYLEDGPLVLDDVSFRAEPGKFVAFVGPSGSGKSTTLRLLLGFEVPETGAVYYDGQDLASLDVTALRSRQLGVVRQDNRLLAGDIFTNIVGASSSLTLEDAWQAAEASGLAGDIRDMPMGMHTVIVEGGSTFSAGQRQRLLIARALVRKPRIILFDEATSALDNRTQEKVTRTLELLSATRIVIAHRLSTIRGAERIYVMDRGRIVEEGGFDELAGRRGLFSRLMARQQV